MLREAGQTVWLDVLSRRLLAGGSLMRLVEQDWVAGAGVTSNPSIFDKALAGTADYMWALPVRAQRYSFGTMTSARAAGDFALLSGRGRRLVRIDPWREVGGDWPGSTPQARQALCGQPR